MLQLKNGSIYQYHTFLKHLYGTYAIADQFSTICSNQKALQQPTKVCSNPQKTLKSAFMRQRGNCCERKSNGMAIIWLLVHLGFYLTSAEPSAVTRGLCSNLPKFAALPRITKICHFQTNWQFLHKKKHW